MTEVYLSIRPNAGMCKALHTLPTGVSYQGMHSVYLHGVLPRALSLVRICLSLPLSRLHPGGNHLFILSWHHLSLQYLRGLFLLKRCNMAFGMDNFFPSCFNIENSHPQFHLAFLWKKKNFVSPSCGFIAKQQFRHNNPLMVPFSSLSLSVHVANMSWCDCVHFYHLPTHPAVVKNMFPLLPNRDLTKKLPHMRNKCNQLLHVSSKGWLLNVYMSTGVLPTAAFKMKYPGCIRSSDGLR